jgi:hypothetical protein
MDPEPVSAPVQDLGDTGPRFSRSVLRMTRPSRGHGHLRIFIGLALTGCVFVAGRRTGRRGFTGSTFRFGSPAARQEGKRFTPTKAVPGESNRSYELTPVAAAATDSVAEMEVFVAPTLPASLPVSPVAFASPPVALVRSATGPTAVLVSERGPETFDAVKSRIFTILDTVSWQRPEKANGIGVSADPHEVVGVALRRTGLDPSVVAPVTEGLRHGAGLEALLLHALGSLPPAPAVPRRAGSLLVVVGAGAPARRLAAALAGEVGIDPTEVPFCSRDGGASALVTGRLLVRSAEDAAELAPGWRRSRPAVVVVDAAVTGSPRSWATHLIASLRPTAVWGVVESTAKTEDIHAWAEALGGIDALALENLEATVSPASALAVGIPVARLDGQTATAARWVAAIVDRITPCT